MMLWQYTFCVNFSDKLKNYNVFLINVIMKYK